MEVTYFMYIVCKEIDDPILSMLYEHEERQLAEFKDKFNRLYFSLLDLYSLSAHIYMDRWKDDTYSLQNKAWDGYTVTIQVEIVNREGRIIEVDENVGTFFENIIFISYEPFKHRYKIFKNEKLNEIYADAETFFNNLEGFKSS